MKVLCVLLGANCGSKSEYIEATKQLAEIIAKNNIKLIYGGGRLGLMGILADTVLEHGGNVTGIITHDLYETEAHLGLSDLCMVNSMQERKKEMMEISDGFIALPGGLGTLEEIFEIWNASKLNLHHKPIGLLNTENYFNKLIEFVDYSLDQKFLKEEHRQLIKVEKDPGKLINIMSEKCKNKIIKLGVE